MRTPQPTSGGLFDWRGAATARFGGQRGIGLGRFVSAIWCSRCKKTLIILLPQPGYAIFLCPEVAANPSFSIWPEPVKNHPA
jgi:hypothetical protein